MFKCLVRRHITSSHRASATCPCTCLCHTGEVLECSCAYPLLSVQVLNVLAHVLVTQGKRHMSLCMSVSHRARSGLILRMRVPYRGSAKCPCACPCHTEQGLECSCAYLLLTGQVPNVLALVRVTQGKLWNVLAPICY